MIPTTGIKEGETEHWLYSLLRLQEIVVLLVTANIMAPHIVLKQKTKQKPSHDLIHLYCLNMGIHGSNLLKDFVNSFFA
jgi:hypothetical protein